MDLWAWRWAATAYPNSRFLDSGAMRLHDEQTGTDVLWMPDGYGDALGVVAIAGTESRQDWATDFKKRGPHRLMDANGQRTIRAHAGVTGAVDATIRMLEEGGVMQMVQNPMRRLLICGHSLGGAVADRLGHLVMQRFRVAVQIVTFGQFMVGDAAYRDLHGDLLAKTGGRHVAYGHWGDVVTWWPMLPTWFVPSVPYTRMWRWGAQHSMEGYRESVKARLERWL